jgi:hypothetical protein
MKNNVADFFAYKKRFTPGVIYLGDTVEWQDFDGSFYIGVVRKIEHKPLAGHSFYEPMTCLPLWEKEEYVVHLEGGTSIVGDVLVRKVIKRASDKTFCPANGGHKYAN